MVEAVSKAIVRRFYDEVLNGRRLDQLETLVAPGVLAEGVVAGMPLAQVVQELCGAFPDAHYTIDELLADGDKVIVRWRCRGTHAGPFRGLKPTNRRFSDAGVDIFQVTDGRITAWWHYDDEVGLLLQLGIFRHRAAPAPEPDTPSGR